MDGPHVICVGPEFGEGPVWCPPGAGAAEGTARVHERLGRHALAHLARFRAAGSVIADTGGGANGAALAADGGFLVTQNGGSTSRSSRSSATSPPPRYVQSGLQRVAPDGTVSYLTPDTMQMPNDLCVAPDGTVHFTDPTVAHARPAERPGVRARSRRHAAASSPTGSGHRTASRSTPTTRRSSSSENGRHGEGDGFVRAPDRRHP